MIKKFILGSSLAILFLSGSILAQSGHGTHTPGTIAAIGNNSTAIGGSGGRDLLLGGAGDDYVNVAVGVLVAGVRYLINV